MNVGTEDTHHIVGCRPKYRGYEHQKCFVGHSHEAEWRDDILSACAEVLPMFDLEPWYAADHFDPTKPLRDKVVELIANARYGIYDLSSRQDGDGEWYLPCNVFIELGMAIVLNRPVLLLRHTSNKPLPLPACLQGVELLDFAGETTLRKALEERLPQWFDVPPDRDWLNRFCIFGSRVCDFREEHPRARQWGHGTLRCHISDGLDENNPDLQTAEREEIRGVFESVLSRYSDLTFDYLNELPLADSCNFALCSLCQTVRSTPFAVYRILSQTPAGAFITIGMSIALEALFEYDIPRVLLVRQKQDLPSLLEGYEVVEAVNSTEVKRKLKTRVPVVVQKIRETAWKPRALPFVEVSVQPYCAPIHLSPGQALEVEVVSPIVGFLNIRPSPSTERPPIVRVDDGAVLEALDPEEDTQTKVGQEGQWLHVRTPDGIEGYVAAWYLRLHGATTRVRGPIPHRVSLQEYASPEELLLIAIFGEKARRREIRPLDTQNLDELRRRIWDYSNALSERERAVLEMRFGLRDGERRTLREIGQAFGVTGERIRQIEARALSRFRHPAIARQLRGYLDYLIPEDESGELHASTYLGSQILVATLNLTIEEVLTSKKLPADVPTQHAHLCDWLEEDLRRRLQDSIGEIRYPEASKRAGETLSVRIVFQWRQEDEEPDLGDLGWWSLLELASFEEAYPGQDAARFWNQARE